MLAALTCWTTWPWMTTPWAAHRRSKIKETSEMKYILLALLVCLLLYFIQTESFGANVARGPRKAWCIKFFLVRRVFFSGRVRRQAVSEGFAINL